MSDLDDLPLDTTPHLGGSLAAPTPRRAKTPIAIIAIAGLALGAAGAWWWARDRRAPSTQVATTGTEELVTPPPAARALPPLAQMDTFLRALLGTLSTSPELARWLATDDLILQMANGIDQVSRGASPARDVGVLRPAGSFGTTRRRDQVTLDPASYRRYDPLATMVASLDARRVADAYRTIQPRLDEAYRGLGRTEGSVDSAVATALQLLIDTPTLTDPVRLVPGPGASFAFADPRLEGLHPAQKQLLRMGPANLDRIITRLREIKAAIDATGKDVPR